jgi:hypothetical protein
MWKIRPEQSQAFAEAAARQFLDDTYEMVRERFPRHCGILGEDIVRTAIARAWERARGYGLTAKRNVRRYVRLAFLLGTGFDRDPRLPWAGAILIDPALPDENARTGLVYHRAMEFLRPMSQDLRPPKGMLNKVRLVEALRRLREESDEVVTVAATPAFTDQAASQLDSAFPQTCVFLGEPTVRRVIQQSVGAAEGYGITIRRGLVLYTALAFVLGGPFDTDPLVPWVAPILKDKKVADQKQRVDRLQEATFAFLKRWLAWPAPGEGQA